ncbi:MAG: hypothetical protein ACYCW6_01665 [Candidatus Xenobia bacterium]
MSLGPLGGVGGAGNAHKNQNVAGARPPQETTIPTRGDGVDVDLSAAKSAPPAAPPSSAPTPAVETPKSAAAPAGPSVPTTLFDDGASHVAGNHETSGPSYISLAGGTLPAAASGQLNGVRSSGISTLNDPVALNHVPFARNRNPFEENDGVGAVLGLGSKGLLTALNNSSAGLNGVGSSGISTLNDPVALNHVPFARNRNPFEENDATPVVATLPALLPTLGGGASGMWWSGQVKAFLEQTGITGVGSPTLSHVGGHGDHTFAEVPRNRNPFEEQA